MKIGYIVLISFCLTLICCDEAKISSANTATEFTKQKSAITAKAIENFDFTDYALSSEAEVVISKWEKYQGLAKQMSYLRKADLSFFNGDKQLLKTAIEDFTTTIPEELKTNPILSRIVILETTLLKLNENLRIDNIHNDVKLSSVKDVLESFSNLNYQINKKIEFDIYDNIRPE